MSRTSGRKAPARKGTPATRADDRRLAANSPVNRRARGLAPLPPKDAATVAAPAPVTVTGAVLTLSSGRVGRTSHVDAAAQDAARGMLRDAIRTLKAPATVKPPHGASRRIRDAFAAENAANDAAYNLLKGAVIR